MHATSKNNVETYLTLSGNEKTCSKGAYQCKYIPNSGVP